MAKRRIERAIQGYDPCNRNISTVVRTGRILKVQIPFRHYPLPGILSENRSGPRIFTRSITFMKNTPRVPFKKVKLKSSEVIAKISAAQKLADAAKKKAQEAKTLFKRVRKAYKLAKKAAKAARSEVKLLKKALETAKGAATRKKAVKARKSAAVRKPTPVKPAAAESVVVPASTLAEVVTSSGDAVEQT